MTDVYLHPGVGATVHFDHIKRHYYGTHRELNPSGIIPLGPASVFAPPAVAPDDEPPISGTAAL